jgi:hypothetical protein
LEAAAEHGTTLAIEDSLTAGQLAHLVPAVEAEEARWNN